MHCVRAAASRTFCTAGRSRPISTAMMAMTTSSSISVKACRRDVRRRMLSSKVRGVEAAQEDHLHPVVSILDDRLQYHNRGGVDGEGGGLRRGAEGRRRERGHVGGAPGGAGGLVPGAVTEGGVAAEGRPRRRQEA